MFTQPPGIERVGERPRVELKYVLGEVELYLSSNYPTFVAVIAICVYCPPLSLFEEADETQFLSPVSFGLSLVLNGDSSTRAILSAECTCHRRRR